MYAAKMDDKGRVKLPTDFQTYLAALNQKFFVTSLDRRIARLYPIPLWRETKKKLEEENEHTEEAENLLFTALELGSEAEMDSQGREQEILSLLGVLGFFFELLFRFSPERNRV